MPPSLAAQEHLAAYAQSLRLAASAAVVAWTAAHVRPHYDNATALHDIVNELSDDDLRRAAASYLAPPLERLVAGGESPVGLFLAVVLANRLLPDTTWRAVVGMGPAEVVDQVLARLTAKCDLTSRLATRLHAHIASSSFPSRDAWWAEYLARGPVTAQRAAARFLVHAASDVTFHRFLGKVLAPQLAVGDNLVVLALALTLPDAAPARVDAMLDLLLAGDVTRLPVPLANRLAEGYPRFWGVYRAAIEGDVERVRALDEAVPRIVPRE
ncbi:hypothetical protein H9P43_005429 [Blastocladiella emersonii ATCC 22665]|nr:hypothetical protein H9P43_005429 [Blastocladiella emersonii ATCC 22665]